MENWTEKVYFIDDGTDERFWGELSVDGKIIPGGNGSSYWKFTKHALSEILQHERKKEEKEEKEKESSFEDGRDEPKYIGNDIYITSVYKGQLLLKYDKRRESNVFDLPGNFTFHYRSVKKDENSGMNQGHSCCDGQFAFMDVKAKMIETGSSSDAPSWRTVDKGLNVEGYCKNPKCPAFEKNQIAKRGKKSRVIAHVGFCPDFDVIVDANHIKCIMCKKVVEMFTLGFYKCRFRYSYVINKGGRRRGPPKKQVSKWKTVRKKYTYHKPGEDDGKPKKYLTLKLSIEKIPTHPKCVQCQKPMGEDDIVRLDCGCELCGKCKKDLVKDGARACPSCEETVRFG